MVGLLGCSPPPPSQENPSAQSTTATTAAATDNFAKVTAVAVTGAPNNYTFAVTVRSPDTGCEQYANWWEVLTPDGTLIYRRILAHSHVEEQPFERTGGSVEIAPDQTVIVRAHMHPQGYGTQAMQGDVKTGFQSITLDQNFAEALSSAPPQPNDCTF